MSIKRYATIFTVILLAACGKSPITAGQLAKPEQQQSVTEAETAMLVFEFPDGARGGHGKIQGTAPQIDIVPSDYILNQIRKCGAVNARENITGELVITSSHRYFVFSDSTPDDKGIVRCVQKSVSRHFSAYVASTTGRSDESFEDLWTAQNRRKNRRY